MQYFNSSKWMYEVKIYLPGLIEIILCNSIMWLDFRKPFQNTLEFFWVEGGQVHDKCIFYIAVGKKARSGQNVIGQWQTSSQ